MAITAHCIVKNEENFVWYAIKSVVDFVDKIIVFDTGSTDKTAEIIQNLVKEYPNKIIFEEKGRCDGKRHTALRQEMLDKTSTDWFMILDGDEVWTSMGMLEVLAEIAKGEKRCLVAPYYLCVGDVYHHSIRGKYFYNGKKEHALPRIYSSKLHWSEAPYGQGDEVNDENGMEILKTGDWKFLVNRYWHASALVRSSKDEEVDLGRHKQVMTYSLKIIGEGLRICDSLPEVFLAYPSLATKEMGMFRSWINLFKFILFKLGLRKVRY